MRITDIPRTAAWQASEVHQSMVAKLEDAYEALNEDPNVSPATAQLLVEDTLRDAAVELLELIDHLREGTKVCLIKR